MRDLIERLLPGTDAALLLSGLAAERAAATDGRAPESSAPRNDSELDPGERELRRVRRQFALGAAARAAQHDLSNPLTALLAEAQLLQLEPLSAEQREAANRIVELARRIASVTRRLHPAEMPRLG